LRSFKIVNGHVFNLTSGSALILVAKDLTVKLTGPPAPPIWRIQS
jgi:hypothetical protein